MGFEQHKIGHHLPFYAYEASGSEEDDFLWFKARTP